MEQPLEPPWPASRSGSTSLLFVTLDSFSLPRAPSSPHLPSLLWLQPVDQQVGAVRVTLICQVGQRLAKETAGSMRSIHEALCCHSTVLTGRNAALPPFGSPLATVPREGCLHSKRTHCTMLRSSALPLCLNPLSSEPSANEHIWLSDLEEITSMFLEIYKHALVL